MFSLLVMLHQLTQGSHFPFQNKVSEDTRLKPAPYPKQLLFPRAKPQMVFTHGLCLIHVITL